MKSFYIVVLLLFFNSCSFDNKTGIWDNENEISLKEKKLFSDFKDISSTQEKFNKRIDLDTNYNFKNNRLISSLEWRDIYYSEDNNFKNFNYDNQNKRTFKSKKISRHKISENILFFDNNIITSDRNGNVIVFSLSENKTIFKYNFYKKKHKNIDKYLNLIIEKNIIYISDNFGFIYALDIERKKILWAKNYKIPFRSNIKITSSKIILANQNNSIYFINKSNGELLSTVPTEESSIKRDFINNFSLNKDTLLFLNTYGSLYSLNTNSMRINWYINLNQSIDLNPSNLFKSNQVIISQNKVFVPTNENFYVIDLSNGSIIFKKNFSSILKPLILNNIFIALYNDLLIATDLNSGTIIFSYDINQKISEFLNSKKKKVEIKGLMFANSKILIFLKNSYVIKFNLNGTVDAIKKLPEKMNSYPIIVDNSLIYLNKKNKIIVLN